MQNRANSQAFSDVYRAATEINEACIYALNQLKQRHVTLDIKDSYSLFTPAAQLAAEGKVRQAEYLITEFGCDPSPVAMAAASVGNFGLAERLRYEYGASTIDVAIGAGMCPDTSYAHYLLSVDDKLANHILIGAGLTNNGQLALETTHADPELSPAFIEGRVAASYSETLQKISDEEYLQEEFFKKSYVIQLAVLKGVLRAGNIELFNKVKNRFNEKDLNQYVSVFAGMTGNIDLFIAHFGKCNAKTWAPSSYHHEPIYKERFLIFAIASGHLQELLASKTLKLPYSQSDFLDWIGQGMSKRERYRQFTKEVWNETYNDDNTDWFKSFIGRALLAAGNITLFEQYVAFQEPGKSKNRAWYVSTTNGVFEPYLESHSATWLKRAEDFYLSSGVVAKHKFMAKLYRAINQVSDRVGDKVVLHHLAFLNHEFLKMCADKGKHLNKETHALIKTAQKISEAMHKYGFEYDQAHTFICNEDLRHLMQIGFKLLSDNENKFELPVDMQSYMLMQLCDLTQGQITGMIKKYRLHLAKSLVANDVVLKKHPVKKKPILQSVSAAGTLFDLKANLQRCSQEESKEGLSQALDKHAKRL